MDNLEEMDIFLEGYNLPRHNQEEIQNMNRLNTRNEIQTVINKVPTNESPGTHRFTGKFYQIFRRVNTYPYETIPKNWRRRNTTKLIL